MRTIVFNKEKYLDGSNGSVGIFLCSQPGAQTPHLPCRVVPAGPGEGVFILREQRG
jgi:hypothetical protein